MEETKPKRGIFDHEKLVYVWNTSETVKEAVERFPGHSEAAIRATVSSLRRRGVKLKRYYQAHTAKHTVEHLNTIALRALVDVETGRVEK